VYSEGLPKILALTEGDRQISAVDLISGEVRWRHTAARPGSYRLRRVGKLLLVAGGSATLFALDLTTGEAVWRYCSRLPFTGALAVDQQSVLAVSGAPGRWQLQHIDPWTGHSKWTADVLEAPLLGKHPLLTPEVVIVPVGNEGASGAEAFDRRTGRSIWRHHADLASATSAWLAFDDLVIINDGAGVLMCLEASTGRPLYNHVFAGSSEADTPRRLEPVLRNGALFVPQQQVHVVRPRTGEIIGTVPPDLVPDLLRVDERCDVYVGEESGHLAAFGAAPRLAVV
jgi:outer membrane protein assembly factor BamB